MHRCVVFWFPSVRRTWFWIICKKRTACYDNIKDGVDTKREREGVKEKMLAEGQTRHKKASL